MKIHIEANHLETSALFNCIANSVVEIDSTRSFGEVMGKLHEMIDQPKKDVLPGYEYSFDPKKGTLNIVSDTALFEAMCNWTLRAVKIVAPIIPLIKATIQVVNNWKDQFDHINEKCFSAFRENWKYTIIKIKYMDVDGVAIYGISDYNHLKFDGFVGDRDWSTNELIEKIARHALDELGDKATETFFGTKSEAYEEARKIAFSKGNRNTAKTGGKKNKSEDPAEVAAQ